MSENNIKGREENMKRTWKDWVVAVRPWSFPASAMPVVATLCYLYWYGVDMDWTGGLLALLGMVLFQAAGNTWSDYFDYKRGVDAPDTLGVRILTDGVFRPREVVALSVALLTAAVAVGLVLVWRAGWPVLAVGLCGVACTLLYPPLKYRAWGDVVILMAYAVLPSLGTSYVACATFEPTVLVLVPPVGLITVAILHANNTRDVPTDRRASIRTLPMAIGTRASVRLYRAEVLLPFVWLAGGICLGAFPVWALLVFVALKPALAAARRMDAFPTQGQQAIARLDEATAQLQLMFSVLLSAALLVSAWTGL